MHERPQASTVGGLVESLHPSRFSADRATVFCEGRCSEGAVAEAAVVGGSVSNGRQRGRPAGAGEGAGMRTIEARPQRAGMKGDGAADVLQEIREAQAEHPHAKRFVRRRGRLVPENPALEVAATAVAIAKAR